MKEFLGDFPIKILETKDWPKLFFEMYDPPVKIFYRGAKPNKENKYLCIVGSRKHSEYGRKICEELIAGLSGYNITIVSGLAFGIDSIAHRVAIENDINTISFPGSGLDENVLYPKSHLNLARKILENGGTIMAEFENDLRANDWTFPKRNRLMAGISDATLIIEAGERSGTMITANCALNYNRDVMAVPGTIFSKNSIGTNRLIQMGAFPINKPEDILHVLGIRPNEGREAGKNGINRKVIENLSEQEKIVWDILKNPSNRDEIISQTKMSASEINQIITMLEIKKIIIEIDGKICQK